MDKGVKTLIYFVFSMCLVILASAKDTKESPEISQVDDREYFISHKETASSPTDMDLVANNLGKPTQEAILLQSTSEHNDSCVKNNFHCSGWSYVSRECHRTEIPHCSICQYKEKHGHLSGKNYTVCYALTQECLNQAFQEINKNIEYLDIIIVNNWLGYLPITPGAIDLTLLSRLTSLRSFRMTPCYQNLLQPFPIKYTNDTFKQMHNLTELFINVPTRDRPFDGMVHQLPGLRLLDLSFTRALSMKNMIKTLAETYNNTIESLYLITFQCVGCDGYNSSLHLPTFLSNKIFPKLRDLVISENAIARLSPGIFKHTPNLKYFAISGNLLLDCMTLR